MITLDGSHGEGGGQIVRTAITLSCITGTAVAITNIRAGRKTDGLRPQHVTAIRAAAAISHAEVRGVEVGSKSILFEPDEHVRAGKYEWSVGTAGATTLVLQTVLLPLALAAGESTIQIHGGTHVPNSPAGHYVRDVYVPVLLSMGIDAQVYMNCYGWTPEGGGTIEAQTAGNGELIGLDKRERGRIERVFGTAIGCNLPSHIPQRIANRAVNLLGEFDAPVDIRPQRTRSISTGAGIFLAAEYTNGRGGFGVIGRKGMPSEAVAEKAITSLLQFHDSSAAVDRHLADQLILPMALASGESAFTTDDLTSHLYTNINTVRAFVDRPIKIDESTRTVTFG
ncbi:MAG: RNA 3'-phosphate cyclase [Anaerolineae bacterium]|nr:RNA 3'-phosphate cyclase [Anaerolineae bacterium]